MYLFGNHLVTRDITYTWGFGSAVSDATRQVGETSIKSWSNVTARSHAVWALFQAHRRENMPVLFFLDCNSKQGHFLFEVELSKVGRHSGLCFLARMNFSKPQPDFVCTSCRFAENWKVTDKLISITREQTAEVQRAGVGYLATQARRKHP